MERGINMSNKENYNIVSIADLHWGGVEPIRLDMELELFLYFIDKIPGLDLVVIAGDYWDDKTNLNSKTSILGNNWCSKLKDICKKKGSKIRIITGTKSHDNDQLDIFIPMEDENFKIIRHNTIEETLPGCNIMYLPDENIPFDDYFDLYRDNIFSYKYIDLIFSHGNYDIILKDLQSQETEIQSINNIIFEYEFWNKLCFGPIISGHWHTHMEYKNLIYIGSYSRFGFGEEESKGFLYLNYDNNYKRYYTKFVENHLARKYNTYVIDSAVINNMDKCTDFLNKVNDIINSDIDMKVRIKIVIRDLKPENDKMIDYIKNFFVNNKRVSIKIKNKVKEENKKIVEKRHKEVFEKYSFAEDKNKDEAEKIHSFVSIKHNIDIPIDFIEEYCNKVREKMKVND